MTERERLIELIGSKVCEDYSPNCDEWQPHSCEKCYANDCRIGELADYLLANGVIVLPELKYKQILYFIYNERVRPLEVNSYTIRPEFNNLLQIHLYKNGFNGCCTTYDIGKTVFLTKEQAEKALKGGEG
ncbi:MAG: hypothetical protein SOV49_05490 [Erysipelotrichaceae bacterium]|nr:hypothetical protein [Erysipelotrichaceae bacterium]